MRHWILPFLVWASAMVRMAWAEDLPDAARQSPPAKVISQSLARWLTL